MPPLLSNEYATMSKASRGHSRHGSFDTALTVPSVILPRRTSSLPKARPSASDMYGGYFCGGTSGSRSWHRNCTVQASFDEEGAEQIEVVIITQLTDLVIGIEINPAACDVHVSPLSPMSCNDWKAMELDEDDGHGFGRDDDLEPELEPPIKKGGKELASAAIDTDTRVATSTAIDKADYKYDDAHNAIGAEIDGDLRSALLASLLSFAPPEKEANLESVPALSPSSSSDSASAFSSLSSSPQSLGEDSSDSSDSSIQTNDDRSVSFAESVVTEVRSVPRYEKENVKSLFYSKSEVTQFKAAYRREKRERAKRRELDKNKHVSRTVSLTRTVSPTRLAC